MKELFEWVRPEIEELFPEPGSFSGLMLLFPSIWVKIIKLKLKKAKGK